MDTLPQTIYIAIGVIAAALISGFWSLISFIIAKDQKISEFRQAWIDSLRREVSGFLGQLQALSASWLCFSKTSTSRDPGKEFIENNLDRFVQIEDHKTSIFLRLNPKEHQDIISELEELEEIYVNPKTLASSEFDSVCSKLKGLSQKLLKNEWERVKRGERSFRYFRNASFAVVVFAGIGFLYRLYA